MPETWGEIIGKHVLVGMTYLDGNGDVIEQKQKHGVIVSADKDGVYVHPPDSADDFWLPPHLESFQPAEEGDCLTSERQRAAARTPPRSWRTAAGRTHH